MKARIGGRATAWGLPTRWLHALAACVLLANGATHAHRGHDALSVVEIDAATGAVVVTHHFTAHDVEPALHEIAPTSAASVDDPDAMRALAAYVHTRFQLDTAAGPVALRFVDSQLAGDDVQLVYRGMLPPTTRKLSIDARMFRDIHPDTDLQVNVRRAGITRTLHFDGASDAQSVAFD